MKITLHNWDASGGVTEYDVKDELIHEFIQWLVTNNSWKTMPDVLFERASRLRKFLIETKTLVGPSSSEKKSVDPTPPAAKLSSAGMRALAQG
jgi:hypothetical protein